MIELKKVLQSKRVDDLKCICRFFELDLSRAIHKQDMVALLTEKLCAQKTLDDLYVYLSDDEIENLRLAASSDMFNNSYDTEKLFIFNNLGYINIKDHILISDAIAHYLSEKHPKLETKRKQFNTLNLYFTACANLYGIVPIELAIDLYNKYEHKRIQKREIKALANINRVKPVKYYIEEALLVNEDVLIVDDDWLEELLKAQAGKPYAILPKEDLLKYTSPDYIEKTPQYRKLVTLLSLSLGISKKEADEITDNLAIMAKAQMNFDHIFEYFEDNDIDFADEKEYQKFVAAYTELSNHTRMWENCGCTPAEIRKRMMK